MNRAIRSIEEQKVWNAFCARARPHTFLHTWEWGEFQRRLGHRIMRVGIFESEELRCLALLVTIRTRKGSFVLCPHGPLLGEPAKSDTNELFSVFLDFCKTYTREQSCDYVRIAPLLEKNSSIESLFYTSGFRDAPIHIHPERAWILDLKPTETALLEEMRKTTRYSIRKAIKDGLCIRNTSDPKDLKIFYDMYCATSRRQRFTPFSLSYIERELESFKERKGNDAQIFFAEYNGTILATAFIVFTPWSGFYHHGAASLAQPKIPASSLLQWEIIREAKRRGCAYYNFWGLAHKNPETIFDTLMRKMRPVHPWQGITLFKTGFGGFDKNYIHAKDFTIRPWYFTTYIIESLRRIKRGL